jgi:cation:H+ antiporter
MVITYILFILGLYLLVKGADWIVDSSSALAKKFGVSNLIIGLTVVAFGTSFPELMIGIFSSLRGASGLVFGNVIGANIANILLILGTTAIITRVNLKTITIWKQIPFALLACFIVYVFTSRTLFGIQGSEFGYVEGVVLLSLLAIFLYSLLQISKSEPVKPMGVVLDFGIFTSIPKIFRSSRHKLLDIKSDIEEVDWKTYFKLVFGLIGIYLGGMWVVDGAVHVATQFGLSQFLISATIISIGTTLPEFIVCIFAALRNKVDLAIGNAIGSVIFNICGVLGIAAIVHPLKIPPLVYIDVIIMFFSTLILFIFMFTGKKHGLSRKEGIVFLLIYTLYIAFTIYRG